MSHCGAKPAQSGYTHSQSSAKHQAGIVGLMPRKAAECMGRGVRFAAVVAVLGVSAVACTEPLTRTTRTRLQATIDADLGVRSQIADVDARIEVSTSGSAWKILEPAHLLPESSDAWPLTFRTTDTLDEIEGATYQLVATARDSRSAVLAQARVRASFDQAQHEALTVLFDDRCVGRDPLCGPTLTCREGECLDPTYDPAARRRPKAPDPDAGSVDPDSPKPSTGGVAEENAPCSNEGEQRCPAFNSKFFVRCEQGSWKRQADCPETHRCSTSAGDRRGTCQRMPLECANRQPDVPFCRDEMMLVCDADLLVASKRPCEEDKHCATDARADARCVCESGLVEREARCEVATTCGADNGGCDALTICSKTASGRTCSACPAGFGGTGEIGCVPRLAALESPSNPLHPAFSADTTDYQVDVPLLVQRITLSARAPEGASIAFNGMDIGSSQSWTSPVLSFGDNMLEVRVQTKSGIGTAYRVLVKRGGKQAAYIKPSTTKAGNGFASWLALSGETLVVGAPFEDSAATGINGDEKNTAAADSGAAYVFVRAPSGWVQQAYLKPPKETHAQDFFGGSVAISGDTLAIGSVRRDLRSVTTLPTRNGVVFVYTRTGGVWTFQQELSASDATVGDSFGYSLAVDGDALAVGAPIVGQLGSKYGAVYAFNRVAGKWQQSQKLVSSQPQDLAQFGSFLTMDARTLVVSTQEEYHDATSGGAVYVFTRRDARWENIQRLAPEPPRANAWFGFETSIFGDELVVGAPSLDDPDRTDEQPGEAWLYERRGDRWENTTVIKAPLVQRGNLFGTGVAVAKDALLISSPGENGSSSGVGGDPNRRDASQTGAVYLYARTDEGWKFSTYLKATNPDAADQFGWMVALGSDFAVVGAMLEDGAGQGIDPPDSDSSTDSGAVYIFQ